MTTSEGEPSVPMKPAEDYRPGAKMESQAVQPAQGISARPAERFMSRKLEGPSNFECGSGLCRTKVNPGVFFGSLLIIWGFIIWAAVDPDDARAKTSEWDADIGNNFSWLYIGSVNLFLVFSFYLVCSRHGDIVLGKADTVPDYSYASWFSMLFSAGVGIGLFFFGVGEPVFHYAYPNRMTHQFVTTCKDNTTSASCFTPESRDYRALQSMNISWYHWGFGASCCYVVVGLPIALYHYKYDQPLTMRTAMYPILGNRIYGWFGDVVEVAATIGTVYGVCTSLGLGVKQIAGGLTRIDNDINNEDKYTKIAVIWIITAVATVSVVTGLDVGIRRISEANFILGLFILGMLFFMGNIPFLLDFFVSEWGYHLQWWFSLSWASDGIAKIMPVAGGAGSSWPRQDWMVAGGFDHAYNWTDLPGWIRNWTIFYWAWWISWAPFVGLFIARISKGRTVREFILGNMFVPTLLTCLWLLIFGGRGLWYEMEALEEGLTCADCAAIDGWTQGWKACKLLSCRMWDMDRMLFDMLEFMPMTDFMTIITTIGISLYFVTSSDSASAVIDQIASNGEKEGPVWQRVFWAVTEGLTATVVIASAGENADAALKALRSISIISALPFCVIMIMSMCGFLRFVMITNTPDRLAEMRTKKDFNINVFDSWFRYVFNTLSLGFLGTSTGDDLINTVQAFFFPALLQIRNVQAMGGNFFAWGIALCIPNACLYIFMICWAEDMDGAVALWGCSWMAFACIGVGLRMQVRERLNIAGTFYGDLFSWMFCGNACAYQEYMALQENQVKPWGDDFLMLDGGFKNPSQAIGDEEL